MFRVILLALTVVAAFTRPAAAHEFRAIELTTGAELKYAIVFPENFDASKPHPVLLAMPLGRQNLRMVKAGLDRYWEAEALARGWVVVSPVAAAGRFFYRGAESSIPELLDALSAEMRVEGGKFHVAGAGNGGRSEFRVATLFPDRVASLMALPGYPASDEDRERLDRIAHLPIALLAGSRDATWLGHMEDTKERLEAAGATTVSLRVFDGEGHVPPSITGALLYDWLDTVRIPEPETSDPDDDDPDDGPRGPSPDDVLTDFHLAAAVADFDRYFGHFADNGVFLGTDASERWTVAEFKVFARPYFDAGRGWTYEPIERTITLSPDRRVAWFDEIMLNEKLGRCRGTGVLVFNGHHWRIAQYNLTVPIPNDLAVLFAEMIREHEAEAGDGDDDS